MLEKPEKSTQDHMLVSGRESEQALHLRKHCGAILQPRSPILQWPQLLPFQVLIILSIFYSAQSYVLQIECSPGLKIVIQNGTLKKNVTMQ